MYWGCIFWVASIPFLPYSAKDSSGMTSSDGLQRSGAIDSLFKLTCLNLFRGHGLVVGFHALTDLGRLIDLSARGAFVRFLNSISASSIPSGLDMPCLWFVFHRFCTSCSDRWCGCQNPKTIYPAVSLLPPREFSLEGLKLVTSFSTSTCCFLQLMKFCN